MEEEKIASENSNRTFTVKRHERSEGNMPAVSVVVPIYNAAYTLRQAFSSLIEQDCSSMEIICVNDCSTDESVEIIDELFQQDERVVIVEHEENAGYGAAMNDGIQVARGAWIAILEPDDYTKPGMYDAMLRAAGKTGQIVDVVKTPYLREVREEGVKRGDEPLCVLNCSYHGRIHPQTSPFTMHDENANHLLRHHPSIWSAIYRKSFLDAYGIRFIEYPGAGWADNEFFYKTLLNAGAIVYLDEPFYVYREETDGEYEAFARNNKHLPFNRWHSMSDIVEACGYADNDGVARSHVSKGFTYLSGELEANTDENGEVDAEVIEEMNKMFDKMDVHAVVKEPKISPALKQHFIERCRYVDRDVPKISAMPYYFGLIGEFFYTCKNNGLGFAMKQVKKILGR